MPNSHVVFLDGVFKDLCLRKFSWNSEALLKKTSHIGSYRCGRITNWQLNRQPMIQIRHAQPLLERKYALQCVRDL